MKISIKDQLNKNNMTRYELAKRIGVTYPTIDNIYKESSTSIKFDTLEAICIALNCSLDDILVFDDSNMRDQQLQRLTAYAKAINEMKNKSQGDTT